MSLDVRVYNHTVTWLARDAGRPFVVRSDPKCGSTWHSGLTECFSCDNYSYNSISALVKERVTNNMVPSKLKLTMCQVYSIMHICTLMGMLSLVPKPHHSAREKGSGDYCTVP